MLQVPRRSLHVYVGAAALCLAIGAAIAFGLARVRNEAREDAAAASHNLALLTATHFIEVFDQIDLGLATLVHGASGQAQPGRAAADRLDAFLARNVTALPETGRFGLTDADGWVIYTTGPQAGGASLRERVSTQAFFTTATAARGAALRIGGRAEPTDPEGLYFSRRVEGRDGAFLGVAFARLPLSEITAFLEGLDTGPNGGVSLRDLDMGIVVRHPDPRRLFRGNATVSRELKTLLEGGATQGTYHSGSTWDGTARTVTFLRLGKYPLYVNVGLAETDYLAAWRRLALQLGAAFAVVVLLMAAAARRFARHADGN